MKKTVAIASVAAASAALAGPLPAAHATFPGPRGPLVFQRLLDPSNENSSQIFRLGSPSEQLTRFPGGAFSPDFSPDGTRLVIERRLQGRDPGALYITRADGSEPVPLTTTCSGRCLGEGEPAWDPSGTRIVFKRAYGPVVKDIAARVDLVLANADGSGEQVIRRFATLKRNGQEPHNPQFSPDGRKIAITIENTTTKPTLASAIYVLNADGSHLRRITPLKLNAGNPDWSPDGKRIVFNSSYEGQRQAEIYTVRPDGSGRRRVHREPKNTYSFDAVWSPDGARIAFVHVSRKLTTPHIWTIRPDGKRLRQETHGALPDFSPDWGVHR